MSIASAADPILGRKWGGYRVTAKVGEGGMGAVYLLVHETMPNRFLAMKVLTKKCAASFEQAKARFEQEAILASLVGSDRVVQPIEMGQFDDGIPFFIMDYVEGRTLEAELRNSGPLRVFPAVDVAFRIADTLAIAHGKAIVHRDVKPSNVMLVRTDDKQDRVKLLDFGVAQPPAELRRVETEAAALVGTRGYMPPEAYLGDTVDGRADVFALGVSLYQMLTDTLPFAPPANLIQLEAMLSVPPPPITEQRPSQLDPVPPWLEALIARTLRPHPEDRPTMHDLRDSLDGARRRLKMGSGMPELTGNSSARSQKIQRVARILFVSMACSSILLEVGLLGLSHRSKTSTSTPAIGMDASVADLNVPNLANPNGHGAAPKSDVGGIGTTPRHDGALSKTEAKAGSGTIDTATSDVRSNFKAPKQRICAVSPSGDFSCHEKR